MIKITPVISDGNKHLLKFEFYSELDVEIIDYIFDGKFRIVDYDDESVTVRFYQDQTFSS